MKRILMNYNFGYWAKAGKEYDVSDERAKQMTSKFVKQYNERHELIGFKPLAVVIKDLGRHFGHSKHTYDKNGPSEAFSGSSSGSQ
jgi:hypothetical protein